MRDRATAQPEALYFRFLHTGRVQGPSTEVTWGQLDRRARRIAARLQAAHAEGERVLLLYPPSDEFIAAFYGCLYAKAVAVPAYPPDPSRLARTLPRLRAMVDNAGARFVLAPGSICRMAQTLISTEPRLSELEWIATDALDEGLEDDWQRPTIDRDCLAMVQYTSGSTGTPRGVRISHANLLHNSEVIRRGFGHEPGMAGVIWLPMYHDMGLVGGVIQPAYAGMSVTLMSPLDFLRRPLRWLEAISEVGASTSGGPDFAYRLCVRKIDDEALAGLDLSSWRVAFTGAEPVRADTLEAFAERFAPCGFDRRAFYPTYGLAECTLMVTGATSGPREPQGVTLASDALEGGEVVVIEEGHGTRAISCGPVSDTLELAIIDPETRARQATDRVGEIWLRGPSVADGYWNHEPERTPGSDAGFGAEVSGEPGTAFLRTGDLGFLHEGELYVTGRLKDLLVLRGRNIHPHDVEHWTAEAHARVRRGSVAAFGVEVEHEERAVVVAEVDERGEPLAPDEVIAAIRRRVGEAMGVELHAVVLVRRGSIAKTSSGKIQRHASRAAFTAGRLEVLAEDEVRPSVGATAAKASARPRTRVDAREALAELVAEELGISAEQVDAGAPLRSFGLDSLRLVELTARIEDHFGRPLETLTLFSYPTIDALATFLMSGDGDSAGTPPSTKGPIATTDTSIPYVDLQKACARIERRSTRYQFDIDADVAWGSLDEPGLYYPRSLLSELGFDVASIERRPEAWTLLQWAMALETCVIFEVFEFGVVYFVRQAERQLGSTRSIALLAEEEDKHIQLFRRYARHLRAQRPQLAERLDALSQPTLTTIARLMRGTQGALDRVRHYEIWLRILVFEEYTVYLDRRLAEAEGVQPAWRSAHLAHRREEIQHLATDVRYLDALDLDRAERYRLSAAFTEGLLQTYEHQFGLVGPRRLLEERYPDLRVTVDDPCRAERCMQGLLGHRAFGHSYKAAPFFRELTRMPAESVRDAARDAKGSATPRRSPSNARAEPIAVIGIGCRFPGAVRSVDELWTLMLAGTDAIVEVPRDRWDVDACYDPEPGASGKMYTRWGGFLDDVQSFDHEFFGITLREARNMDPQQRILLEVAWESLEHAGIPPSTLAGTDTSVFVGICSTDYSHRSVVEPINAYSGTGAAFSVAAGRISYTLGLHGECLAVDTACSSSLVAVHQACRSLESRESSLAIVGGVNAILAPKSHVCLSALRAMSPVGRCKTFDAEADGYVRGEGCGVVVLTRLEDAIKRGDRILAVIRGTAVNQDGRSNGLTAPSGLAQESVMRAALGRADLEPAQIDYVEAHGTATPLGDPIELQAIGSVHRGRRHPVKVGSIKTQIGHTEGAAGIAGLIKATMVARHGLIPPNLHFHRPTPHVPWSELPVEVVSTPRPLEGERRISINSFGFGGTNAHAVLEPAPIVPARSGAMERPVHPILISGRTDAALAENIERLREALSDHDDAALPDIAHTLATGRDHHGRRVAFMAGDLDEVRRSLEREASRRAVAAESSPRIAMLFTGQGAQYFGMGQKLYQTHPHFRAVIDEVATALDPHLPRPLRSLLFDDEGSLTDTALAQPALFAVELATASLWRQWGIEPAVVLGHSLGELSAACFAEVLSLADAAELVAARGRLMQALPRDGAMVSVSADETTVREAIAPHAETLCIAAVNAPTQIVISGSEEAALRVAEKLSARGIETRRLDVSHAFHSSKMLPVVEPLEQLAGRLDLERPRLPMRSTVDPGLDAAELSRPAYWSRQVLAPVRFADALARVVSEGVDTLIEVGPSPALLALAAKGAGRACARLPSMRRGRSDWSVIGDSLCHLHAHGATVDWKAFDAPYVRTRITLPSYAFSRTRCWLESAPAIASAGRPSAHPLLGTALDVAGRSVFETSIGPEATPWIADHRVSGCVVVPATAWLELLLAAAREVTGRNEVSVVDVEFSRARLLHDERACRIQVVFDTGGQEIEVFARGPSDDAWVRHARGRIDTAAAQADVDAPAVEGDPLDPVALYDRLASVGLEYGPRFRGLRSLRRAQDRIEAEVALPDGVTPWTGWGLHPALLDAALQAAAGLFGAEASLMLPVGAARYRVYAEGEMRAMVSVTPVETGVVDVVLRGDDGVRLAEVLGLRLRPADAQMFRRRRARGADDAAFVLRWIDRPAPDVTGTLSGRWLVLGAGGLADGLAERLRSGAEAVVVDPGDPDAATRALAESTFDGVVLLASTAEATDFERVLAPGLQLLQARLGERPRVTLVTRGAQQVGPSDSLSADALASASLWGLGRTAFEEMPSLSCRLVDLDPTEDDADALARLWVELHRGDDETQVAWRADRRFVCRLVPVGDDRLRRPEGASWRLVLPQAGVLDSMTLEAAPRPEPGPGQVEIAVEASGLNFRDVMGALGMIPGMEGSSLGGECAGRITAVGEGVESLSIGDPVMGLAPAAFGRHVLTDARWVVRRPMSLERDPAAAATIPVAFATAWYALYELADLQPRERVLVHAAAGGVGMAAVQLARRIGAHVFGTASRGKWSVARRTGVESIMDSRTSGFGAQILEQTEGAGVDVVLNSLTGTLLKEGFEALGAGGRFIEIGKTELWDEAKVREHHADASYRVFDLLDVDPETIQRMLRSIVAAIEAEEITPLPRRVFAATDAVQAFRTMARAQHVGKIVLTTDDEVQDHEPDEAWLITGGLGALGRHVARALVERGVRHLVLVSRRPPDEERAAFVEDLRGRGAEVRVQCADVSKQEEVRALVDEVARTSPPLAGVVHAAGLVDDGPLLEQRWSRFDAVLGPKAVGAWWLHVHTRELPLRAFVLFSSVAGSLGSAGQSGYAAANAFLDALAYHRQGAGLPATSIGWGPWAGEGMAARLDARQQQRLALAGLETIEPSLGLQWFARAHRGEHPHLVVAPLDRARARARLGAGPVPPVLAELFEPRPATRRRSLAETLSSVGPSDRRARLLQLLQESVAQVIGAPSAASVDPRTPLRDMGLDSLMAVDLHNAIAREAGRALPETLLFDHPTLERLADHLLTEVLELESSAEPAPEAPASPKESLTETEATELLAHELRELEELLQ